MVSYVYNLKETIAHRKKNPANLEFNNTVFKVKTLKILSTEKEIFIN